MWRYNIKILIVSPLGFPVNKSTRYAGIEVLVYNYACELSKNHQVTVMGHSQSEFPSSVTLLSTDPTGLDPFMQTEIKQYQTYQSELRKFDVIHDFSHQHFASRFNPNLPSLNIFWHAPALAQYPKAPYNIIALSNWARREFERVYKQKARYQYSICIDTNLYKRGNQKRNDRFYALGRMGPEKGNLEAAQLCLKAGVPLDIQGARGTEFKEGDPQSEYEKQVLALCDGKQIRYIGDPPQEEKIRIMQTNRALIYATSHPEVTSHKDQECLLCGMPIIVSNIGAAPEIVTHGVNGYLCNDEGDFLTAIKNVEKLQPEKVYGEIVRKFGIEGVVKSYIPLYEEVAGGLRW